MRWNVSVVTPGHLGCLHVGVSRKAGALAFNLLRSEVEPWGSDVRPSQVIVEGTVSGE